MAFPRVIWCLWFQGWENAPPLVRACGASWRQHNPDWQIVYLSEANLAAYCDTATDDLYRKDMTLVSLSNVIRVDLLRRHGGVWADATTYCLRPLNDWIYPAIATGFFAFDRPTVDRMLSSWFLAAQRKSYIVDALFRRIRSYWNERNGEPDQYHWFHHDIFYQLYKLDDEFRRLWDLAPKLSANGPHYFLPYEESLPGPVTHGHRLIVETAQTPMLKLTHKIDHDAVQPDAVYRWLCDRIPGSVKIETATAV
jgi:Capsular polysaccharide synthesis protein